MCRALKQELRAVRDTLLEQPVSPRVATPADINRHYCRYVADTVAERVGDRCDITVLEDGGHGFAHTWLYQAGSHFDAECIDGVADHRELPFFQRHPKAAMHVEPGDLAHDSVRHRGEGPLYPDL